MHLNCRKNDIGHRLEKELIERCQEGDEEAFRLLFERYQERIFRLQYFLTGNREDAEELTQETFLKMYRSIAAFHGDSQLFTWLYRIALNEARQYRRRRKLVAEPLNWEELATRPGLETLPVDAVLAKEEQQQIKRVLNLLPQKYRTILILKEIEGLSYDEIAQILGLSKGTVASRLNRARQRFAKLYREEVRRE